MLLGIIYEFICVSILVYLVCPLYRHIIIIVTDVTIIATLGSPLKPGLSSRLFSLVSVWIGKLEW